MVVSGRRRRSKCTGVVRCVDRWASGIAAAHSGGGGGRGGGGGARGVNDRRKPNREQAPLGRARGGRCSRSLALPSGLQRCARPRQPCELVPAHRRLQESHRTLSEVVANGFQKGHDTDIAISMLRALEASLSAFEKHRQFVLDQQKTADRR